MSRSSSRLFHENGRLKHPHEWDDDTAASIASIEIVTRNLGDGEVEYIHRIKLWDKGKALEQLCKHLGLYRDQGTSEQPGDRPLTDLTDEELYQRLLDARARLNRAIEHEQGIRGPSLPRFMADRRAQKAPGKIARLLTGFLPQGRQLAFGLNKRKARAERPCTRAPPLERAIAVGERCGDIALIACFASSWTPAMVRRRHADPFGFLRPWNEVPALMGSAPPATPPRPAPAWSPS